MSFITKEEALERLVAYGVSMEEKTSLWIIYASRFTDSDLATLSRQGPSTIKDFVAGEIERNTTRHNDSNYKLLSEIKAVIG